MIRHLSIVLLDSCAALEEILRKLGLPYRIPLPNEALPSDHAVYVVPPRPSPNRLSELKRLSAAGVFCPKNLVSHFDRSFEVAAYAEALEGERVTFRPVRKRFAFETTDVTEEAAARPGSQIRDRFWTQITQLYRRQNLFCPSISAYPNGYEGFFSFRVDADEYEAGPWENFFQTAQKYASAVSIFFCMSQYAPVVEEIKRCQRAGMGVHSHAFTHYTYRSYKQNLLNMRLAEDVLRAARIENRGFASPYGRWNPALQRAVETMGYRFSSEFSYNHDDFPSYPVVAGKRSTTLQIPVHPVGLGIYMEAARQYNRAQVERYYANLFALKRLAQEPIIFYDHPTNWLGHHPEFLDFVFDLARTDGKMWIAQMQEWAEWWTRRNQMVFDPVWDASEGRLQVRRLDALSDSVRVYWHDFNRGLRSAVTVDAGKTAACSPAALDWTSWEEAARPSCGQVVREASLYRIAKQTVKYWLDWETSTPVQQLIVEDPASFMKKACRGLLSKPQR